ncbi:MAG: hypothetical protein ABJL72_16630, partial [Roseobacter sp.]
DVNELGYGDKIEPFMRDLAEGSRIYIWLTDQYLKSPYCMFELHQIWHRSLMEAQNEFQSENTFDQRVLIVLGDASVRLETDIEVYRLFWDEQFEAISAEMQIMHEVDLVTLRDRNAISRFKSNTGSILRYVRSRIHHSCFEDIKV